MRWRLRPGTSVAATVALCAAAVLIPNWWLDQNLHEVVPGLVYRSAQLSPTELDAAITKLRLKHIINLRGAKPGASWYEEERAVARTRNVTHQDLDFATERLPPRPQVVRLIEALTSGPVPVLVHCDAGADRAGLASVIARLMLGGARFADARRELSAAYGHVWFGSARELNRFFDLYDAHRVRSGVADDGVAFEAWLTNHYVPYAYGARIEVKSLGERLTPRAPLGARLLVTNVSGGAWELSDKYRSMKVGVRIREEVSTADWMEFARATAPGRVVKPGGTLEFTPLWHAPGQPGRYLLKIDMVDEMVTWFEDQGSTPLILPLVVTPP